VCSTISDFFCSLIDTVTPAGAQIIGRISDRTVIQWRQKRGGVWYPEDRLRAALLPFLVIIPVPLVLFGLVNRFVDGMPGLIISLACLFVNGVGVGGFSCFISQSIF